MLSPSWHLTHPLTPAGEPEADMAISKWFLCGHDGVFEKNEELAFKYAERAASAGLATAEFALGYFYEIGMHVLADLKEAQLWYGKVREYLRDVALDPVFDLKLGCCTWQQRRQWTYRGYLTIKDSVSKGSRKRCYIEDKSSTCLSEASG